MLEELKNKIKLLQANKVPAFNNIFCSQIKDLIGEEIINTRKEIEEAKNKYIARRSACKKLNDLSKELEEVVDAKVPASVKQNLLPLIKELNEFSLKIKEENKKEE